GTMTQWTAWRSTAGAAATRCDDDADVPKGRTTVTLDERVLRAVKVKAAGTGRGDSELIEEVLAKISAWTSSTASGLSITWPRMRPPHSLSRHSTRPAHAAECAPY